MSEQLSIEQKQLLAYVEYSRHITGDIDALIADLDIENDRRRVYYACDYSEIHAFIFPSAVSSEAFWPWPDIANATGSLRENSALLHLFFGTSFPPVLLEPYSVELRSHIRALAETDLKRTLPILRIATEELDRILRSKEGERIRRIASDAQKDTITPDDAGFITAFLEQHGSTLLALSLDSQSPYDRYNQLLQARRFVRQADLCDVKALVKTDAIAERFRVFNAARPSRHAGANYVDAMAVEVVYQANRLMWPEKCVRLVTRSRTIAHIIAGESSSGLWERCGGNPIRHPRCFSAHLWPYGPLLDGRSELPPRADGAESEIGLNRRTREYLVRHKSGAELLLSALKDSKVSERDRTDIIEIGPDVSRQIQVIREDLNSISALSVSLHSTPSAELGADLASPVGSLAEHVQKVLACVHDSAQVGAMIRSRIDALSALIEQTHELIGWLIPTSQTSAEDRSRDFISMESEFGKLVLRSRPDLMLCTIQLDLSGFDNAAERMQALDVHRLQDAIEWFSKGDYAGNEYQRLLIMSFTLGLLGRWSLAESYATRAMSAARRSSQSNDIEARFFGAICRRKHRRSPDRFREALRLLKTAAEKKAVLRGSPTYEDPRFVAEEGTIYLAWYSMASEMPSGAWQVAETPTLERALGRLIHARSLLQDDQRLELQVVNNILYAFLIATGRPSATVIQEYVEDLWRLSSALDPSPKNWPAGVLDTCVLAYADPTVSAINAPHTRARLEDLVGELRSALTDRELAAHDRERFRKHLRSIAGLLES